MKQPILLKTILDICFIFLAFNFTTSLIGTILSLSLADTSIPITIAGNPIETLTAVSLTLLVTKILIGAIILYTIYLLRKLIRNFFKGVLYTRYQIASLKLIGQLIILSTTISLLTNFLANLLMGGEAELKLHLEHTFSSFWFVLALGLFFMYLSKIFNHARTLREENELTI